MLFSFLVNVSLKLLLKEQGMVDDFITDNNSIFLEAKNAMVIGCYADTYEKGFKISNGTVTCCRIYSNPAFYLNLPVNELSQNVRVFGNNF